MIEADDILIILLPLKVILTIFWRGIGPYESQIKGIKKLMTIFLIPVS